MKIKLGVIAALFSLTFVFANESSLWKVDTKFSFGENPESVLIYKNSLFISDMGKDSRRVRTADGNLVRMNLDGTQVSSFKVSETLHSPMGMAVLGNIIYVVDIDRILGFSVKSGDLRFKLDLSAEGATFLNDIVTIDRSHLLVSATNLQKIFLVNIKHGKYTELDVSLSHPNGLAYDSVEKILYVAGNKEHALKEYGNGELTGLQLNGLNKPKKVLEMSFGKFIDGVAFHKGKLLVSDWKDFEKGASLFTIDATSRKIVAEEDLGIKGVADFSANDVFNKIYLPNLIDGEIYILRRSNKR